MFPGMLDKLYFQIYYSECQISYGPSGVDFSGFQHIIKGLNRANERTIVGVCKWLMRHFQLDPQQHELKLRAVLSRATQRYFGELVLINAISIWRQYVNTSCEHGLLLVLLAEAYQKDPTEINFAEVVVGISQAVMDKAYPTNIRDEQDVGDVREMQPMGVVDEGSTSLT